MAFKMEHYSGKYVHPAGGKAQPDNGTKLVIHGGSRSGVGGDNALTFQMEDCGSGFKLKHWSGKYVHPEGGKAVPDNGTKLVIHGGSSSVGGDDALTFYKVSCGGGFKLKHFCGKYVHPEGGQAHPGDGTELVLHDGSSSGVGGENALTFS